MNNFASTEEFKKIPEDLLKTTCIFMSEKDFNEVFLRKSKGDFSFLINELLKNKENFEELKSSINNCYLSKGEIVFSKIHQEKIISFRMSINTLKTELENLINLNKIPPKAQENANTLTEIFSKSSINDTLLKSDFTVTINKQQFNVPAIEFVKILSLPPNEFERFALSKISPVETLDFDNFFLALKDFFTKNNLENFLILTEDIKQNILDIKQCKYFDFEFANQLNSTAKIDLDYISCYEINPELETAVLHDLPKEYSDLQKAIFVYAKLCEILTYDVNYYVENQKGKYALIEQSLDRVKTITPKNNEVVCYVFNAIYAKFLNKLGINFQIQVKTSLGNTGKITEFTNAHANLIFKAGTALIEADSVTGIYNGDLSTFKMGENFVGLNCINSSCETQKIVENCINQVVKDLREKFITDNIFKQSVSRYKEKYQNDFSATFEEKISIFLESISSCNSKSVDSINYYMQLYKIIFPDSSLKKKVSLTIAKVNDNNKPRPIVIVTKNNDILYAPERTLSIDLPKCENEYFISDLLAPVRKISSEELTHLFNTNKIELINPNYTVPNIKIKKKGREKID